jgi:hypothetical protein
VKRRRPSDSSAALNKIGDGIIAFNDLARTEFIQARQTRPDTTPERLNRAIAELRCMDPPFTEDEIVAIADLFSDNSRKTDTFLALEEENLRRAWVRNRLKLLNFPA